jgi:dipeptidyl aminopeptidase/acylaminoacyl peptidase
MRDDLVGMLVLAAACALSIPAGAQAPPGTDIFLAPLTLERGGARIGAVTNITHRPGYDNQPSFTPDGKAILFTSIHDDGQADIYRYDLASRSTARVTSTPESEYSPTVMPGGQRFSVIRVERDSTQRLWSFAMDGSDPQVVLPALEPVGYHAWLDRDNVVTFVLGRPNALVLANMRDGHADTLARDIGRSLLAMRGGEFSYVQNGTAGPTLRAMNWSTRASRDLMTLPGGSQDIAWLTPDLVLTGEGARLLVRSVRDANWREVADLASAGLSSITRLAVSPDGKWLAIVAMPAAPIAPRR